MKIYVSLLTVIICIVYTKGSFAQDTILHFEDIKFEQALLSHAPVIDLNKDGRISEKEAGSFAGELNIENKGISSVEGIAWFTHITKLLCAGNHLLNIPFGIHPELTEINCDYNQLIDLDVTGLPSLAGLSCVSNRITFLSLVRNLKIAGLDCRLTPIVEVYINRKTNPVTLKIQKEKATEIRIIDDEKNPYGNYPQRKYDTF